MQAVWGATGRLETHATVVQTIGPNFRKTDGDSQDVVTPSCLICEEAVQRIRDRPKGRYRYKARHDKTRGMAGQRGPTGWPGQTREGADGATVKVRIHTVLLGFCSDLKYGPIKKHCAPLVEELR
eukprot:256371-Prorocentrum_minimum.AAC.2